MTGMHGANRLGGTACAIALLALAGCDAATTDQQPAAQGQRQRAEGAQEAAGEPGAVAGRAPARGAVDLGTFSAPQVSGGGGLESRLPAEPERTILVADSALYPGAARLDPGIENPYTDQAAIDAGERHFTAFNCDGCHAPLAGGGMGPPLSDDAWIHGGEPAQIFLSIMHGRPEGMPAWASMLPARTVWELVAYIGTLSEIEDHAAAKGFELRGPDYALGPAREEGRTNVAGEPPTLPR